MSAITSHVPPVAPAPPQQVRPDDTPASGPPPVGQQPAAPDGQTPRKFAGKYADEPSFRAGLNEARKAVGLGPYDDKAKLIGDGGLYATPEAAEAHYSDYTALIGRKDQSRPASPTNPKPLQIGGELTDEDGPEQILERAGLTDKDVAEQFAKSGKLTDDQYAAIRKINPGYGKRIADEIVRGRIAIAQVNSMRLNSVIDEAARPFGGKDEFDKFLRVVAPQFLSAEQQQTYTKLLNDPATTAIAARDLKQMHMDHVGGGGGRVVSGQPGGNIKQKISAAEFESLSATARGGGPNAAAAWTRIMQIDRDDITP